MTRRLLRRTLENAGILIFACLLAMSLVLGRTAGAMLWGGALLVFYAHAWQARCTLPQDAAAAAHAARRWAWLRVAGLVLAAAGAASFV